MDDTLAARHNLARTEPQALPHKPIHAWTADELHALIHRRREARFTLADNLYRDHYDATLYRRAKADLTLAGRNALHTAAMALCGSPYHQAPPHRPWPLSALRFLAQF